MPVKALETATGADRDALRRLNLALLDPVWSGERFVPRDFEFRVPASAGPPEQVLARLSPADQYAQQRRDPSYRVGKRETLAQIARREGTTTKELMALNRLSSPNGIRRGMVLRLPEPKPIGSAHEQPAAATSGNSSTRLASQ